MLVDLGDIVEDLVAVAADAPFWGLRLQLALAFAYREI